MLLNFFDIELSIETFLYSVKEVFYVKGINSFEVFVKKITNIVILVDEERFDGCLRKLRRSWFSLSISSCFSFDIWKDVKSYSAVEYKVTVEIMSSCEVDMRSCRVDFLEYIAWSLNFEIFWIYGTKSRFFRGNLEFRRKGDGRITTIWIID